MLTKTQAALPDGHWGRMMSPSDLASCLEHDRKQLEPGGWVYEALMARSADCGAAARFLAETLSVRLAIVSEVATQSVDSLRTMT